MTPQARHLICLTFAIAVSFVFKIPALYAQTTPCPDLVVEGVIELQATDGFSATITATVHNIGEGSVEAPFTISLLDFSCCQWEPGKQHVRLSESQLGELNATGSVAVPFAEVTFADEIVPCFTCRGVFAVDTDNEIDESCYSSPAGEGNNIGCPDLTIEVTKSLCECSGCSIPIPEEKCISWLFVSIMEPLRCWQRVTVMGPPQPTCHVELEYVIRNVGTQDAGPFAVAVQGEGDCVQRIPIAEGLAAGEKLIQSMSCTLKPALNGVISTLLTVTADSDYDAVNERTRENNAVDLLINCECEDEDDYYLLPPLQTACSEIPGETYVDLSISATHRCVYEPEIPGLRASMPACQISVDAIVSLIGEGSLQSPVNVSISDVVCGQDLGISGERQLTKTEIEELNEHGSVLITDAFRWSMPFAREEGLCCSYTLTVDSNDMIRECPAGAEENNNCTSTFCCESVEACPDIAIEILRDSCRCESEAVTETRCLEWNPATYPPVCVRWGGVVVGYETLCEARVYYKVKNIGAEPTGGFWVTMETSTGCEQDAYVGSLAPGEDSARWFDIDVGDAQTLTVTLVADERSGVEECDEENNTAEVEIRCR